MIIIGPVLENEPANWEVRIGDKKFSAKMTDSKFLSLMAKGKIAFGINDYIITDLETIVTINEGVDKSVKHYIRKAYSYPKYKQQTDFALF